MKSNLEWLHNSIFLSITFYDKTSAAGERMDQNQLELKVISAYLYSLTWFRILVSIVVFTKHNIPFSFTHNAAVFRKIKILRYFDAHVLFNGSWN